MSTLTSPTSAFVCITVIADAEIVTNVGPSVCVHVEVLNVSHLSGTCCFSSTGCSSSVMDYCKWSWSDWQLCCSSCSCSPLSSCDNSWTILTKKIFLENFVHVLLTCKFLTYFVPLLRRKRRGSPKSKQSLDATFLLILLS